MKKTWTKIVGLFTKAVIKNRLVELVELIQETEEGMEKTRAELRSAEKGTDKYKNKYAWLEQQNHLHSGFVIAYNIFSIKAWGEEDRSGLVKVNVNPKTEEDQFTRAMVNIHLSFNADLLSDEELLEARNKAKAELETVLEELNKPPEVIVSSRNRLDILNKEIDRRELKKEEVK